MKRAVLFLVFILSGAWLSAAIANEASPQDADAIRVLSDRDRALYQEIFTDQEQGRWKSADKKIAQLEDKTLMGYVEFQRYMHPTAYRSKFSELKQWMAYYRDHPNAKRIYSLARKRRPKRATLPVRPTPRKWRNAPGPDLHPDLAADYAKTSGPRLRKIEGRVRFLARKERALDALKEIERHHKRGAITTRQFDRMRSWIAASLYYQGFVDTADKIATAVAKRNGDSAVYAYWIAGLIDFREGDAKSAYNHFSAMAAVPYQDDSFRAGAGFWAARTALAAGAHSGVTKNLEIAARYPFTFYGQLALAQLGKEPAYDWRTPTITAAEFKDLVDATPRVKRAVALAEVGRANDAELELRWANGSIANDEAYALMAVAMAKKLPAAQIEIALSGAHDDLQAGLYPIPDYAPRNGFTADRALLYALMRQESKFKVEATSRVGARGLMQLMPRTASFIAKDRTLRSRAGRDRLYDPALNLHLGQTYVNHLIETSANGDLFHMAAAYNGGPGNLRRWRREMEIADPLLFIESIPNPESRDFVEKVLTNVWVYRARLGQPAPTRDKVAAGELPLYEALDALSQQ